MGQFNHFDVVFISVLLALSTRSVLSDMDVTEELKNTDTGNTINKRPGESEIAVEKTHGEPPSSALDVKDKSSVIEVTLPPLMDNATQDELTMNVTVQDDVELSQNNSNSSESTGRSRQWNCTPIVFNNTYANKTVILIEEANLTEILNALNKSGGCALMYFYLRWCRFSCMMSAKINMIGLYYPEQLPVVAVDVHKSPGLAAKYGIVGVPTTLLFYGKKPVAKFNGSASIDDLHLFIKETTGFASKENISTVLLNNTIGPLPTTPDKKRDVYLFFSILFLVFLSLSKIVNTETLIAIRNKFYNKVLGYFRELQHVKSD